MKRNEVDISDLLWCPEFQPTSAEMRCKELKNKFGFFGVNKYVSMIEQYKEKHGSALEAARISPMYSLRYYEREEKVLDKWTKLLLYKKEL